MESRQGNIVLAGVCHVRRDGERPEDGREEGRWPLKPYFHDNTYGPTR